MQFRYQDRAVSAYKRFVSVHGAPFNVLYPGCGNDTSPSEVFPHVVYVDCSKAAIRRLQMHGFDARISHIKDFVPDRDFDLLLAINFDLSPLDAARLLKAGYVICTGYPAKKLFGDLGFSFLEDLENPDRHFDGERPSYFLFRRRAG